jgi:signal transduction histidine kinase
MLDDPHDPLAPTGKSSKAGTQVLDGASIRQRLASVRLPVMPQVLSRLLDACLADAADPEELASLIALDPGLAARLASVGAASASPGGQLPANLAQCLAGAGSGVIRSIATGEAAASVFGGALGAGPLHHRLWAHAVKSALVARVLARSLSYPDPEEAYLAGLLHDAGMLVLAALDPAGYPRLATHGRDDEALCRVEQERYGATHAEVGAWLTAQWQLGSFLSDSVLYHHAPAERVAGAHPLIRIVLLAQQLAQADRPAELAQALDMARLCGVTPQAVAGAQEEAGRELQAIADELGIALEASAKGADTQAARGALAQLGARLERKLLLDSVGDLLAPGAGRQEALQAAARAALALFGLRPAVFFLREASGAGFTGHALAPTHQMAGQLAFVAGQSDSVAAQATLGSPAVWFEGDPSRGLLDAQLARLLGAPGLVCIPLGAQDRCTGVAVAALQSRHQAEQLQSRMDLLRAFGRLAGPALDQAGQGAGSAAATGAPAAAPGELPGLPVEVGATGEQIRQLLHEVSNPLTIVGNYLATLKFTLGNAGEKELRIVSEEIGRVTDILNRFQSTPRAGAAGGPVELRQLIESLLGLCAGSGLVPPGVKVESRLHAGAAAIAAQPDKLKQVLLNLMKNAFEAMPGGGSFSVSTTLWSNGADGSHAEIILEDSGPGLPPEVEQKLFQPVASSKGGQHFGIGLSIAGQLVREMGGLIHCHSSAGGCRFRILLPVETP